jgi:hypothetical protein
MKWLAIVLSLVVTLFGAIGVVSPESLLGVARHFETTSGLLAAAALRVALGAALFVAAPESRQPGAIRALGAFVFLAGLVTPFFGTERVRVVLDWWAAQGPLFMRAVAGVPLGLGSLLLWALLPKSTDPRHAAGS